MSDSGGRSRAGARRGARARPRWSGGAAALLTAAVAALIGWGLLVWLAIHLGRSARGGDQGDWWWLLLAAVAAAACLFAAMWCVTAALRRVSAPAPRAPSRH